MRLEEQNCTDLGSKKTLKVKIMNRKISLKLLISCLKKVWVKIGLILGENLESLKSHLKLDGATFN